MSTNNIDESNENIFSTFDDKSKKCIEKLGLTESELCLIHKALIIIHKTCEDVKSITYINDESAKLSCGRSFGSISFDLIHSSRNNINDLTNDQELKNKFDEQIKQNQELQDKNDELMHCLRDLKDDVANFKNLYKEAVSRYKSLELQYDTLMNFADKSSNYQNKEISSMPPTVETIKSSTNYKTSSYDSNSDINELDREILDLSDYDSSESNPFKSHTLDNLPVKKNQVIKKNDDRQSTNNYEEERESVGRQQHKFQKNVDRKESLIEKGKKLCQILNSSNYNNQIQRISHNSLQEISNALNIINNKEQISITDIDSAKNRLLQWHNQDNQCEIIQNEIHKYKLYHLKMLYDIYSGLANLGKELNTNKQTAIGNIKSWVSSIVKNTLVVSDRTERRYRSGCIRIQSLLENGITYQQLVNAGCTLSTFYGDSADYKLFVMQLPTHIRNNVGNQSNSLTKFTNILTTTKNNKKVRLTTTFNKKLGSSIVMSNDKAVIDENAVKERQIDKQQPATFTALLINKSFRQE
ncbi:hypothetical protein RclHR1_11410003 [Rhizophagus clarus]|uniref:Uncharacterized protein n=1 Tax=Rhizophagus clarus TaxID=94130 RepID=A0A2Z6Q5N9_9GLOM|nr:hypothetical protein RclHR1_11410003 [Rhizophagus clarus]GES96264.1 hypothetical protein GLOIN_2v1808912 [Rhizophagus clarus]